ncbi:MAG: hypothetical protein LBI44_02810 [Oscillospiraceae bacterium]|jgi:CRISPR/Cas system type I-B associated protein Csh2 (Cas7 group RAMP superfamily)|nr:hypothetical protein [Oscillospiraceae bacterium]
MGIVGVFGAIPRTDHKRMDEHAERYYEEIRRRKSDAATIAKNTGFSPEDVEKIRRHIFMDEHELGAETPLRFSADYDMAVSWQRLADGRDIKEMDIVLLKHELAELELMARGLSYDKAHEKAEAAHNYARYIRELDAEEGAL